MPKRIIDVIKELNVGLDTIVEFLSLKGENVEQNPNAKITDEQYELLVEEFDELASILNIDEKELLTLWQADQFSNVVSTDYQIASDAMQIACEQYRRKK